MSNEIKTIPLMDKHSVDDSSCSTGCGNCSSTGCNGGHVVKAGSSNEVVYMNLIFFALIVIVMIVTSYLVMKILAILQ
jgi:uncharacterized membrane protein YedE/YeeE